MSKLPNLTNWPFSTCNLWNSTKDIMTILIFIYENSLVKTKRIWEQINENPRFLPPREFSQGLPRFSPGYKGTENMFYFFSKIIIFRPKKAKDHNKARMILKFLSWNFILSQFGDKQPYYSRHFCASWRNENTLINYINFFRVRYLWH